MLNLLDFHKPSQYQLFDLYLRNTANGANPTLMTTNKSIAYEPEGMEIDG